MENCSIVCKKQYGFRKGYSTVDAIVDYSEFLCKTIENKNYMMGVFIDYFKDFDTVNHSILLSKLEICGIRDMNLKSNHLKGL